MSNKELSRKFEQIFGKQPEKAVRAPGRINLIGEHTDYNDGFVLPAAIDKGITILFRRNGSRKMNLFAADFSDSYTGDLDNLQPSEKRWPDYVSGVISEFQKLGKEPEGFDCLISGDLPIGAGLSSSAALECGIAFIINEIQNFGLSQIELIKLAQRAENNFAGVNCGIMDQFAVTAGQVGKAVFLDCRTLEHRLISLDFSEEIFLLFDTKVTHSLAGSEYNQRRAECEKGVAVLQKFRPEIRNLGDAEPEMIREYRHEFEEKIYRRCLYVTEENRRVKLACDALETNNLEAFGELLYASHEGLSELYEVSCPELDFLVEHTFELPAVFGARMVGGGFGGCTLNLVKKSEAESVIAKISGAFRKKFGREPGVYAVNISDGVQFTDV